ncbi:hypothetical protein OROGR_028405 [Orobanche gracilis]
MAERKPMAEILHLSSPRILTQEFDVPEFSVLVLDSSVHQGSALSPFLFAIVMDELTRGIQNDVPWCMMFADDIVLIDETKDEVQQKLELWRDTLEARGFRLSRSKTEYMECRFCDNSDREAEMITFDGKVVHGSTFFRYLGSIIQKDGELDGDVAHRIKAGWLKWKSATGVLCDPDMPHRLKGKFYRTTIRPALLYGTECWAVKQCHVQKMNVAEMRMLRWMCGHTKKYRLRNEVIREKVRVASIEDKMMENRLRWFGHVRRRPVDAPVRSQRNPFYFLDESPSSSSPLFNQPDAMGSRYNSTVGPSNDKIYTRTFGFDCRCFMPMHGYKLRNSNLQESFSVNLGRKYSAHATMEKKSKKMLLYLTGLVFTMVGCCYAAVPLYKRFCQDTGYGGTVQRRESVEEKIARHVKDGTVTSREVIVQFNADVADGMPWKFIPTQREVRVKPGESALAFYTAENRSSTPITGVSTYNVTPMKLVQMAP